MTTSAEHFRPSANPHSMMDSDADYDTQWSRVDEYTMGHLHPASRANTGVLATVAQRSREADMPWQIATPPPQSKWLALQARAVGARAALEVGTLGAYTAVWLATENPGLLVTSIEVDPEHARVARENVESAGLTPKGTAVATGDGSGSGENAGEAGTSRPSAVEVLEGAALDVLPQLLREIEENRRERFGLTYIDADKVNNWKYFDLAVRMSHPGAIIVVDNVVRGGKLVEEGLVATNPGVRGAREVVERVGKDPRVDGVVMQTVSGKDYDGFLYALVRK